MLGHRTPGENLGNTGLMHLQLILGSLFEDLFEFIEEEDLLGCVGEGPVLEDSSDCNVAEGVILFNEKDDAVGELLVEQLNVLHLVEGYQSPHVEFLVISLQRHHKPNDHS